MSFFEINIRIWNREITPAKVDMSESAESKMLTAIGQSEFKIMSSNISLTGNRQIMISVMRRIVGYSQSI